MKRYEIINLIIQKHGYERYLEIGTWMGECISKIECPIRHGVDPGDKPVRVEDCKGKWAPVARQLQADPKMHFGFETIKDSDEEEFFNMTSDQFFECIKHEKLNLQICMGPTDAPQRFYDFIFIDGCHTYEQSLRDFENSLPWLHGKGTIMLHDTLPASELRAKRDGMDNGEVWKTAVKLRCTRPDLEIITVDTDMGCTLISKREIPAKCTAFAIFYDNTTLSECLTWSYFEKHRKELLNIISVDEFIENYTAICKKCGHNSDHCECDYLHMEIDDSETGIRNRGGEYD